MKPTLPQNDPLVAARRELLSKAREEYRFDRSIADCLFAEEVPMRDKGGPGYWARLAEANGEVSINKVATAEPEEVVANVASRIGGWLEKVTHDRFPEASERLKKAASLESEYPVADTEAYARAYGHLPDPSSLPSWEQDDFFAWIALAGANPTLLTRLDTVPDKLALSAEDFRASTGDELGEALAERRVYVVDYEALEGATGGEVDGYTKYICAPIAVFAQTHRGFVPVGIQMGQSPADRFITPADGVSWRMAKVATLSTDSQLTGLVGHFGLCHLVMEAVVLASKRNLAPPHPIRILLDAHTENTLIVNDITRSSLTPVDGAIDRMMAQSREASLDLTARSVRAFRILDSAPPDDFARRGVDDVEALPVYPYRDDQLLLWHAIETWIEQYVRTYYANDEAVQLDEELQAFTVELEAEELGGLAGIGLLTTVDQVVALLARIVFRATVYHAALNYALYDFGYAPLQPQAQFGPGPTGNDTEEDLLRMLPPYDIAYEVIEAFYPLKVQINRLGHYGDALEDPRLAVPLQAFHDALADIETTIEQRNTERLFAYPFCLPSRVSNSIHV